MAIVEKIKISDEGISTLKKLKEEHKSFKDELKSTKKELKETWDKKYKPAIETTSAVKSIKNMQNKADDLKSSLNAKVRLNDNDTQKIDSMKSKFKAFGKMVASPFVKIKGTAQSTIHAIYQKMIRLGSMVVTPIVRIKDNTLSKLKSSIKLFQDFGKKAIAPVIRLKDYASVRLGIISTTLGNIASKVVAPMIKIKDASVAKIQVITNKLNELKNKTISIATKIHDYATPKLNTLKSNLLFLGKLSIQPVIKLTDLASAGIQKTKDGIMSLAKKSVQITVSLAGNAVTKAKQIKDSIASLTNKVITPIVSLKDNCLTKLQRVRAELKYLAKTVARPIIVLKDNASIKVASVLSKLKQIGSRIVKPIVSVKDNVGSKLSFISSKLSALNKKIIKPVVQILDKTKQGISAVTGKLASIGKKIMIPVAVTATVATAALGASIKSGMDLEKQQVSIEHFIGATNKDYGEDQIKAAATEFTEQLRANANATPFETGEVIQAGSRAIAITQGNTQSAMSLVKLAEDMASASGGTKSVSDAMEALADAKLGEMERLKEFGFKVSAEEFQNKGFEGVSKDLEDFYGGASEKLAATGSGLLSTITGKLKSGVSDFGLKIVDQLKPVLINVIGFVDKAMPFVDKMGTAFGETLGNGIQTVSDMMPSIISGVKQMMPVFNSIISGVQQMMPPIMAFGGTLVNTIKNIVVQCAPVIDTIIQAIARILPAVQPIFSIIATTIGNIITTVLPPLGTAFSMIADVIVGLAPIVTTIFEGISVTIGNVIGGISEIIQGGLDLISSIWSGNWQGVVDAFGTILGGIGEIAKAPINAVIAILNGAIDAINSVSIETPDWLPFGWGGKKLGFDLGHIDYLAKGGIVNKATPAIVGEAGKEAVMPLENNTGWISHLAGQIMSRMSGVSVQLPANVRNIPITNGNAMSPASAGKTVSIVITIAKLADSIIVKEKQDIDDIAEQVADKILEVAENL